MREERVQSESTTREPELHLSIIVPVLNEERVIAETLAGLNFWMGNSGVEIIIVDGGSHDRTLEEVRRHGSVRIVEYGRASRGLQMNAGAAVARGDVLLFLHADVRLPQSAVESIVRALPDGRIVAGCFQIHFPPDAPFSLQVNECGINLRTRLFHSATGDQAIFVRRPAFETVGGYQDLPLMEDIVFFNEIKKIGRVVVLDDQVAVSPRRWLKHGVWRTMFLMYALRLGYWVGVSPATLKRFFIDVR